MGQPRLLRLSMGSDLPRTTQRRLAYAFRSFCAIYGYQAIIEDGASYAQGHPRICYGTGPTTSQDVAIPALYTPRPETASAHPPTQIRLKLSPIYTKLGLDSTPCFYTPKDRKSVDWLGEIFEWLSCADEYAVTQRDDIGRIPFAATVHGRFGLDPSIPYAAIAMYELNRSIRDALGGDWPDRAMSPAGAEHVLIAPSHDIDYLPISPFANVKRLLKNVAIATLYFRDPVLALSIIAAAALGLIAGRSPLDCIDEMVVRELAAGIRSTYNVICYNAHARDANYELEDPKVKRTLQSLAEARMEIALHGSYTSLADRGLQLEIERLAAAGYRALGVRQHWLRFAGDSLFEEVAKVGLSYDSSVGFAERVGFRAGACFPYFPYDFRREQEYRFVEIPLAIMDVTLYEQARRAGSGAPALCQRVFDMVESFGWGGVAILWHNTVMRGGQMPLDIGTLYWKLKRPTHNWVSCRHVAEVVAPLLHSAFSIDCRTTMSTLPESGNSSC